MMASMDEENQLIQQQEEDVNIRFASHANLPCQDLLTGDRENYIEIGLPLYKASVKGDWEAAKVILAQKPELVRYSITENGDTPLHVVAAAKQTREVITFVENLVRLMEEDELALENKKQENSLYLACVAGNIETVKVLVEKNSALLINAGNQGKMMPLQAAALYGNHDVVKYLCEKSNELADGGWTDENRSWLLLKCVETDMFDIALRIVKKYPTLGSSGNVLGVLARKPEAFKERNMNMIERTIYCAWSLTAIIKYLKNRHSETDRKAMKLLKIIWKNISKKPKVEIDDILRGPPDLKQDNMLVSGKVDHALQLQKLISERIVKMHIEIHDIIRRPPDSVNQKINPTILNDDEGLQLQQHISEQIAKMQAATTLKDQSVPAFGNADETYSSRILFIAAEMGNTIFIIELVRQYPDLIWQVNDNNQSIFHIAIQNRHEDIYNLLYEIGGMKDSITHLRDEQDNNMLHIVAKSSVNQKQLKVSALFQMQRELLWFMEIERMIPPSYREQKNKDGLIPRELFTKEHKSLHAQAENWMKKTASQSMVIAVLVATIAFAAAFTIPGGYNQDDGIPMFRSNTAFLVFVISDAVSLVSSCMSIILMFLTILKSPFAETDFLLYLPNLALLGLATLSISLSSMMITFCASFFVLYNKQFLWIPFLIASISVYPTLLYTSLQRDLLVFAFQTTFYPRFIFNPKKRVLY